MGAQVSSKTCLMLLYQKKVGSSLKSRVFKRKKVPTHVFNGHTYQIHIYTRGVLEHKSSKPKSTLVVCLRQMASEPKTMYTIVKQLVVTSNTQATKISRVFKLLIYSKVFIAIVTTPRNCFN